MQFIRDNKMLLGGIIAVVFVTYIYFTYFSGGSPTSSALLTTTEASPLSADLLSTLASLHTIKLDNTIFSDPTFLSLSDFGVEIPAEKVGRPNPFAPLPSK